MCGNGHRDKSATSVYDCIFRVCAVNSAYVSVCVWYLCACVYVVCILCGNGHRDKSATSLYDCIFRVCAINKVVSVCVCICGVHTVWQRLL